MTEDRRDPLDQHVALFVDFENLALAHEPTGFDLWKVIDHAAEYGRVVVRKAYADWRHYSPLEFKLVGNNVDLIQVYSRGMQRKNGADIRLSVDAMDVMFTHPHIDVFILAASDSDYTGLVLKLREHGKFVVGIGSSDSHSEHFRMACDEYLLYSELIGVGTGEEADKLSFSDSRELLIEALKMHAPDHPQLISQVRKEMNKRASSFSESSLGFESFLDFLNAHTDILQIITEGQLHYVNMIGEGVRAGESGDKSGHLQELATNPAYWRQLLRENHKIHLAKKESLKGILTQFWETYGPDANLELSRAEMEERLTEYNGEKEGAEVIDLDEVRRVDKLLYMAKAFYFPKVNFAVDRPGPNDRRRFHERIHAFDGLIYEFNLLILTRLLQEHLLRKISPERELLQQFLCDPADDWTDDTWHNLYGEGMARAEQVLESR